MFIIAAVRRFGFIIRPSNDWLAQNWEVIVLSEERCEKKNESREQATEKLRELLHCGNERVELSAAKEILAKESEDVEDNGRIELEVTIRVVE